MPLHGVRRCTRETKTIASLGTKRLFLDRIHRVSSKVTRTAFCQWGFFTTCANIFPRYKKRVNLAEKEEK
jgi:hypothetical protein